IINLNHERNEAVETGLAVWAEHRAENQFANNSADHTQGQGYWDLVAEGPCIIARLMLDYYDGHGGWWHELLHEILHGEKSGSPVYLSPTFGGAGRDGSSTASTRTCPRGS
ncbi:hypothetical protein C8A00DRAFT_18816, partial [Chaetomidium leptoderma]